MGRYDIQKVGPDLYELYENKSMLCKFSRENFQKNLNDLGRGSNWAGSVLRLLNKKYPVTYSFPPKTTLERLIDKIKAEGIADYLRSKGHRVVMPINVPDKDLVAYLESSGYVVEGIFDGVYYSTFTKVKDEKLRSLLVENTYASDSTKKGN